MKTPDEIAAGIVELRWPGKPIEAGASAWRRSIAAAIRAERNQQAARIAELEAKCSDKALNAHVEAATASIWRCHEVVCEERDEWRERAEKAEAERDAAKVRHMRHVDHAIDLSRIIEALCHGYEIPIPASGARHHYEMAMAHRLTAMRAAWIAGRDAAAAQAHPRCWPSSFSHHDVTRAITDAIRALAPPEDTP